MMIKLTVKKFMITIVGENPVGIDEIFDALEHVINDYFSVHENETDELRTCASELIY